MNEEKNKAVFFAWSTSASRKPEQILHKEFMKQSEYYLLLNTLNFQSLTQFKWTWFQTKQTEKPPNVKRME